MGKKKKGDARYGEMTCVYLVRQWSFGEPVLAVLDEGEARRIAERLASEDDDAGSMVLRVPLVAGVEVL